MESFFTLSPLHFYLGLVSFDILMLGVGKVFTCGHFNSFLQYIFLFFCYFLSCKWLEAMSDCDFWFNWCVHVLKWVFWKLSELTLVCYTDAVRILYMAAICSVCISCPNCMNMQGFYKKIVVFFFPASLLNKRLYIN